MRRYRIRSGDNLSRIASRFEVPLAAIMLLNEIRDPNRIRVGQELEIPEITTDGMDSVVPPAEPPPTVEPSPGEPPINRTRFMLPTKEYVPAVLDKDLIVLHFTAGRSAKSAHQTWLSNPVRVATAYLVDSDGTTYEVFNPSHWAYHLGIKGTRGRHDKRSIGIEIANVGPLKADPRNPDRLNWWPRGWDTRYCGRDENTKYVEAGYRGIDFFASMPDEQLESVGALVRYLCERFGIFRRLRAAARRTEYAPDYFSGFRGIAAHQNFRRDKWDIGPAFPWERLGI